MATITNINSESESESESESDIIDLLVEFSQTVINDHMKMVYETYFQLINNKFFSIAIYKPLVLLITNYYNLIFQSLILKNDSELLKRFDNLILSCEHKELCLLNILFKLTLLFLHNIMENHHKFKKQTLADYMDDINNCILNIIDDKKEILKENLSHECKSLSLDKCDKSKLPFTIKENNK